MTNPKTSEPKKVGGGTFVALVGAATVAIATPLVMQWEGTKYVGYRDIVGIATKCTGDTYDVVVGKIYTKAECDASLERQLIAHAKPVLTCTPVLRDKPEQLSAAISLAYNIGPSGYCRSSVARRFNAGDFRGACDAFLMWNKAGGRPITGLTNRRKAERAVCLKGLPA